ncbi:TonB-dependent receptor [Chitinophaga sp. MM2321]|uniref:SusC/RagA family TonB-linked outer membrane protein n=1 Tax=Chitinophaga sp. MM2321 TaxID=3137178 RepID=UPI0032D59AE9
MKIKFTTCCLFLLLLAHFVSAQTIKVSGTVTAGRDQSPLPGVTIVAQTGTQGTVTDANGNYVINVGSNDALLFKMIGSTSQIIPVKGKTTINVVLTEEESSLNEVIVVGYGSQKRADLTGAVSTVSSNTLLQRPVTNASNLLEGRLPGLQVTQPSGQPGKDDGIFQVRGLGSFGASSAPLILVDGVVGSITNLAPNDIENVTVLKDAASASIYGSRAANGVILITTKRASKGRSIEYKLDVGSQAATKLPDLIYNSAEYMQMYNSALTRSGMSPIYSQEQIDAYANATDKNLYPNFNWMDYYFNPATSVNHYLGLSNSTEKSTYKFSMNYLNQDGILPNINYKRYNAQLNFTNQVSKAIKVGTIIGTVFKDNHEPPGWTESSVLSVIQNGPLYRPFLPDGSGRKVSMAYPFEPHNATSPVAFSNGARFTKNYGFNGQVYADVNLFKGLQWTTRAAVQYSDNTQKDWVYKTLDHYYYQKLPGQSDYSIDPAVTAPGATGVTDNYNKSILPTLNSVLTYETQIARDHNLKVLAGYEQQSFRYQGISGRKVVFPDPTLVELDAGGSDGQTVGGTAYEWGLRSYFARLNYDYKGKYLLQANARYDGTSRVSDKNRWGLFPSVSAGWRISEENFMKKLTWMDNLKFRGSWGVLGNQEIGNYPYQDILSFVQYPFGTAEAPGVVLTRLTDKNLKWESTKVIDFGADIDIFKGLFGVTVDWFKKNTTGVLATQPVPASLGLTGPVTNNGELQNTGWEMELRHNNTIGEFTYGVNMLLSTYKNKLISIVTPTKGINEAGLPYNSFYLYEMIGIFQSQEEVDKSPKQILFAPKPGDIKIKDQNGDGVVDAKDRVSYSPYPKFSYSLNLNAAWKAFTFSIFFQGVQGLQSRIYGWGWDPFVQGDPPQARFRDAWTPTNPSNTIPAVYIGAGSAIGGYGGVNAYESTYQLQNASYLRIKNINISYTLPKRVAEKIWSQGIRVYFSGDNLFTFTKYPAMDPERRMDGPGGGRAFYYPQVRILNAGVDFKF